METTDDDMTTGINNGKAALKMFDSTIAMTSEKNSVAVGKDGILLTGKTKVDGSLNVVDGDSALGVSNGTAAMRAGDAAVFLNGVQANVNVGTNGFTVDASGTRVTGGLSVENSKITNVADGVNANDAATVGQLNSKVSESVEGVVRWDKDDNGKYTDNQIKGVIFNGNGNLEVTDIKSANYSLETVGANTQHIIHVAADDKDNTTGKAYTQIEGYNQFFEDGTVSLGNGGTKTVYVGGTDGIKFIGAGGKNNTIANLSNTEFKANETYTGGYAATQEQVQDAYKQAVSDAGVASDQKIQDALDKTVGDLDKLNTNNKGNIVDSINEVNNKVGSGVLTGDLAGKNITDGLNTVNGKIDGITNTVNKNNENMTGITYDKASDTTNIDNNVHITGGVQVDNDIKANGNIVGGKVSTSSGADLDEVDKRVGKLDRLNDEIKNNAEYKKDSSVVGAVNAEADIRRNEVARIDSNVSALSGRVDSLESRMGDVEERIDKVGAMSAAIANLRTMGFDPEAPTEIAVGVGQYKSETGLALGVFHYPNQDFMLSASISTSGDEVMGGIGATWKLGRKSAAERARISEEKAAEKAAEIKAAAAKAAKDAEVNAQREKHAQLLAQREAAHQDIHQSAEKA